MWFKFGPLLPNNGKHTPFTFFFRNQKTHTVCFSAFLMHFPPVLYKANSVI